MRSINPEESNPEKHLFRQAYIRKALNLNRPAPIRHESGDNR